MVKKQNKDNTKSPVNKEKPDIRETNGDVYVFMRFF